MDQPARKPFVGVRGVRKSFGGVHALAGIDLDLEPGEVHGLVGENGAGKSTLGRILGGVLRPDAGDMRVDGDMFAPMSPRDALRRGICYIPQELSIVPERTVVDNVFLGSESSSWGLVSGRTARRRFAALRERTGFDLAPGAIAGQLRLADQQKVEILRALARDARLVIMDEPTAALGVQEALKLLDVIRGLRAEGVCVVLVTHFLDEILAVSDRITVLKDGALVQTTSAGEETKETLLRAMLGQELGSLYPDRAEETGPLALQVEGLCRRGEYAAISLEVRQGEIVGLAGLVGSGRTEVARTLAGLNRPDAGTIRLNGAVTRFRGVSGATASGVVMIPEERKAQGLFANRSVGQNVTLPRLGEVSRFGVVRSRRQREAASRGLSSVGASPERVDQPVMTLSGGNQQKVLFARWLSARPTVLIADEPTRGVDMGARAAIYRTLREHARSGAAVIVISSDNDEVVGLSDRLYVMRGGSVVAEMPSAEASEERLLSAMLSVEMQEGSA